jgi:hypothetical protein
VAKIFGVLLIVLGVWVGMEIYNKGMDGAFGGAFAGWSEPIHSEGHTSADGWHPTPDSQPAQRGSLPQRVGVKVRADIAAGEKRDDPDSGDEEDNN